MVIGLIVVALAMVVAGLVAVVSGSDGIGLESGWALVIAGSVASTGGVLVLALAFILRELRNLPDRLETAHTMDETVDTEQSPFGKLAPIEPPDRLPIPQVVQGPGFARPVKPVGDQAPPVFAGPARPADERAAPASRSSFPSRDLGPLPGAASGEELPVAEPVDKAPPVFPDFSPRALLEASRAKRKDRGKPVDPDLSQPQERGAGDPTVVIPSDAMRGEERHDPSEHEPDAAAKSADDLEKALLADPPGGKVTEETAKEGPAIVGTYRSNGTVYVMYADGSIEADTPEGLFRFGSLEELKAHIAINTEANDKRQASPA